jgi:L-histidine N-alpha-methyltransferase
MPERLAIAPAPRVDVFLRPEERFAALREDVERGLSATPKELPPKWFYDERGSQLFDEITRLPEYYLTDAEREILERNAHEIARATNANTLVELGSGTSEKTRLLLTALAEADTLRRYVPVDVSEPTLRASAAAVASEYPGIEVHAVVGDLERHLARLPEGRRRLVAFLGSSIGNLGPAERARFLVALRKTLKPGEAFLLGTDLVKDPETLERAYNDSAGVTEEFNLNLLRVLDRELGAAFVLEQFEHVARWDEANAWIEMLLRSRAEQLVAIAALDRSFGFADGEELRTEISCKFTFERVEAELAAARFRLGHWWLDRAGRFAVSLSFAA